MRGATSCPRRGPDQGLSIRAYGDNVRLYRSVLSIAMEVARDNLQSRKVNRDGELMLVRSHQALATLRLPQPIRGGRSNLSAMDFETRDNDAPAAQRRQLLGAGRPHEGFGLAHQGQRLQRGFCQSL